MTNTEMIKKAINHLLLEDAATRTALLREDDNLVRSFIRHCIHEVLLEIENYKNKESLIREIVQNMIYEGEATGGSPEAPSDITAMNFLKNLLKNIIPSVEEDYKELTSTKTQRASFRTHILNAAENLLNNLDADPESIEGDGGDEELEELKIKVGDDKPEGFIDIYGDEPGDEPGEELSDEEEFAKGLEDRDLDKTGRNAAFTTFTKIKNQIENEYSKLDPESYVEEKEQSEREIFRDYLLLNFKLYFDRFEEELSPNLVEPVTPSEEEFVRTGQEDAGLPPSDEMQPAPAGL
jgi:hypothetical protein